MQLGDAQNTRLVGDRVRRVGGAAGEFAPGGGGEPRGDVADQLVGQSVGGERLRPQVDLVVDVVDQAERAVGAAGYLDGEQLQPGQRRQAAPQLQPDISWSAIQRRCSIWASCSIA